MGCKLGVAVAIIALVRVCSALLACGLWWVRLLNFVVFAGLLGL